MRKFILIMLLAPAGAGAQEMTCQKPSIPACGFETAVWMDEARLKACMAETEAAFQKMDAYRECLWDYRDDAIFKVEHAMNELIAEMVAFRQFSRCRIAAGPSATTEDIERCPVPEFVQK